MAMYSYVGNKDANNHTSRILFSTGKDMVVGEQIDLTAVEIAEVGKLDRIDVRAGSVAVPITNLNFPAVQKFVRIGIGLVVRGN
jgi:hypothetical protein